MDITADIFIGEEDAADSYSKTSSQLEPNPNTQTSDDNLPQPQDRLDTSSSDDPFQALSEPQDSLSTMI